MKRLPILALISGLLALPPAIGATVSSDYRVPPLDAATMYDPAWLVMNSLMKRAAEACLNSFDVNKIYSRNRADNNPVLFLDYTCVSTQPLPPLPPPETPDLLD